MQFNIAFYLLLQLFVFSSANLEDILKKEEIIPKMIDKVPSEILKLEFPTIKIELGTEIKAAQTENIPKLCWSADSNKYYTLVMLNPDAPSSQNPTLSDWNHWLVVNIPENQINNGEVISAYIPSGPAEGIGLVRYVFLVYEQSDGKMTFDEPRQAEFDPRDRANFPIKQFARKYNLMGPIAVNFYRAEYDDSVPILYNKLGF